MTTESLKDEVETENEYQRLGRYLKEVREMLGLSQREVSEALSLTRLSSYNGMGYLFMIETGIIHASNQALGRLARGYKRPVAEVFTIAERELPREGEELETFDWAVKAALTDPNTYFHYGKERARYERGELSLGDKQALLIKWHESNRSPHRRLLTKKELGTLYAELKAVEALVPEDAWPEGMSFV